jgi:hypothetical protein
MGNLNSWWYGGCGGGIFLTGRDQLEFRVPGRLIIERVDMAVSEADKSNFQSVCFHKCKVTTKQQSGSIGYMISDGVECADACPCALMLGGRSYTFPVERDTFPYPTMQTELAWCGS